ncbi:peroxiredoxin [Uliginosibacterium sp. 31-16]|uniref:peroxiredoxin n=1 Tax=Uliginosibacterium sp. 31-16 TaxID=3068315 RepID=UPI00273F78B0|nr:peroxiredoxin [Uliginosibacterium sp. 31-16]MDP5241351.1 peroxiredoxin [Uliginosibacterium sp. 31-16]
MGQLASWSGEMVGGCRRAESLLAPGNTAPVFCLPDADMGIFDLSEAVQRKTVVLHFYPRDVMPSSLKQAIAFSEHDADFARCGALVVGVSLDECLTHADFRDENGIAMELLSDPEGEVCRLYGVWQDRLVDGVVRPAVHRSTFVIGSDGVLLHADYNVDLRDHTEKLLELLKTLNRRKNGNHQEHRRHA